MRSLKFYYKNNFWPSLHAFKINWIGLFYFKLNTLNWIAESEKIRYVYSREIWGAGMAQWWERSPPTNVAWVQFRPRVICGSSLLLVLVLAPRVFLRVLRFSSLHKNSKFQFDQDRGPAWKPAKADVASSLNIAILNSLKYSNDQRNWLKFYGERNTGLRAITASSYKQPNKLSKLQNTQLNLLTVTFLAILKWTKINLRWLIVDGCVKEDKRLTITVNF